MTEAGQGSRAQVLSVYCERGLDPTFWAEPVNALTNAAFVILGAVAFARARDDSGVGLLAVVAMAIGVGSFLFHTFATRWALLADVAPIQAFIALYFFLAMRRFFGLGAVAAALVTGGFMAAAATLPALFPVGEPWRGLGGYAGGLLGLAGVGGALALSGGDARRAGVALLGAASLFALSLAFRTADRPLCDAWPTGLHGAWHLLNAVVLFTLMAILRRNPPRFRPNSPML